MCGIAGVAGACDSDLGPVVRRMCQTIIHRGPDDEGYFDDARAHLGMRRLAIVDVDHGRQPMTTADSRYVTVFNGEVYNFQELRASLQQRGAQFRTASDTEVVLHAYAEFGPSFVNHLRGMFGLAIWDTQTRTLVLARDRVGKKPLYYYEDQGRIWFGSELKCLLATDMARELDPVALDLYLTYQYVPAPWTILKGVRKLPPGHVLEWRNGSSQIHKYWDLTYTEYDATASHDVDQLAEEFRHRLLEATRLRLTSERPLGAFLSGGLDSSAVVAAMSHLSVEPVRTFSIGFADEAYNELPYARQVADLYGTDHHELVVSPDIEGLLPRLARAFDEPYADSSAVPSFYLAEMASRDVVVALNGDGGDESFGGYTRYTNFLTSRTRRRLPAFLSRFARQLGKAMLTREASVGAVRKAAVMARERSESSTYGRMVSYFRPEEKSGLYRPEVRDQLRGFDPYALVAQAWERAGDTDDVNKLLAMDVASYLPGDLLPKVDITTMMVSLEARSPFLDQELMTWAASLPGHVKVRSGQTKYLMKRAMEPWLPSRLIHRKKKGFGIPRNEWLRGPLLPMVHDLLRQSDSRVYSYLRPEGVESLITSHLRTGREGNRLWALLMLELWFREVLERVAVDR